MALSQEQFLQLKQNLRTGSEQPAQQPATQSGGMGDFATGFTKSLLGTARNVAGTAQDIGQRVLAGVTPGKNLQDIKQTTGIKSISNQTPEGQAVRQLLTPKNQAEQTGALVSEIAQFLAPSSAVLKGQQALGGLITGSGKLAKAGRVAVKAGTEAAFGGGLTALQRGDIDDRDVKSAALISAMFPVLGATVQPTKRLASKGLEKTGQKIQTTVLKPGKRELEQGFKIENVSKYGLGGNLEQTLGKSEALMNKLSKQLNKVMKDADTTIDLVKVYDDTVADLTKQTKKQFGENAKLENVLNKLQQEIAFVAPEGKLKVPDANTVKRAAGKKGAWVFGNTDPDSTANEIIYSKFYSKLKDAIEKAAPEVADINKQLSEIIPIQNAALKRIPVEQRNQAFGLLDTIGLVGSVFDPKALGIIGANRLAKSGRFGNLLVEASQKLKNPQSRNVILERYLGELPEGQGSLLQKQIKNTPKS